ncbi:MAG: hypothetical protein JWO38_7682 [Gemmataceae bacterium]|nr:hypothetical protein [Gemmataceae bacterium]
MCAQTIFTEVIDGGAVDFQPSPVAGIGTITIKTGRKYARYAIAEIPTCFSGRAVRMTKSLADREIGEPGSYDVLVGRGGQDRRCECKGFLRWNHCKHEATLRALLTNGWLDMVPAMVDEIPLDLPTAEEVNQMAVAAGADADPFR